MSGPTQIIVVSVQRVVYRKEDSGWCIVHALPQAFGDSGLDAVGKRLTCKGVIGFEVREGDRLQLEGYFGRSQYNGEMEFSFRTAIPHLPADLASLLHYAVSITNGLGEAREGYIWAKYGERWIEQDTLDIPGVPERVQANWRDTLRKIGEQKHQTQAITFLLARGCTLNLANVAWSEWGTNTIGTVQADCYALAQLPRYGFKGIDQDVRHHFGIGDDDPRRIEAAILYVMGELAGSGSTVQDTGTVQAEAAALVPVTDESFARHVASLVKAAKLRELDGDCLTLVQDYENEAAVFGRFANQ